MKKIVEGNIILCACIGISNRDICTTFVYFLYNYNCNYSNLELSFLFYILLDFEKPLCSTGSGAFFAFLPTGKTKIEVKYHHPLLDNTTKLHFIIIINNKKIEEQRIYIIII